MPDDNDEKARETRRMVDAYSLAWLFPLSIGAGWVIGWGLDKLFHTSPWLTWIFLALGVAAAFVNLFRIGLRG
jgi:ATP synthase protein I